MNDHGAKLYLWIDGEPGVTQPNFSIDDIPGASDRDLVANAVSEGMLGRYLPVRLYLATNPSPGPNQAQAIDTAKLLQSHAIRHRRRYEIMSLGDH